MNLTEALIGGYVLIILAVLVGVGKVLDFLTKETLPKAGEFIKAIDELKAAHAVNTAKIDANTARLDRQGDTQRALLLASPSVPVQELPAMPPQAPLTPSGGFQGIDATPEPEEVNLSKPFDRNKLLADIEALKLSVGTTPDPTEAPPPAVPRPGGENDPTPGLTAHSQE